MFNSHVNFFLQLTMGCLSLVFFVLIATCVKRKKMDIEFAIVWFVLAFGYIIIAVFPDVMTNVSEALNIQLPVNALFLINIAFLIVTTLIMFLMATKTNKRVRKLIQEISLLKKHIDDKEKEYEERFENLERGERE